MARGIPQKMKAAVLHNWNDLRYEDVETPQYREDEVLCRVADVVFVRPMYTLQRENWKVFILRTYLLSWGTNGSAR